MRLIEVRRDERGWFAAILILALAQSAAALVTAWMVKELFDSFTGRHHAYGLPTRTIVLIFVLTAICSGLLDGARRRAAAELSLRRAQFIRVSLFQHLINNPGPTGQRPKGGLLLPFVGDLTAVRRWIGEGLGGAVSAAILVPVLLAAVASRDARLAFGLFLVLLFSFACSLLLLPSLDRAVREVRRRRGALTGFIIGRVEAAATIHVAGRAKAETRKVQSRIDQLSKAERWRALVLGGTSGVGSLTRSVLVLCTLVLGFHEARAGRITAGGVAAILTLVHLLNSALADLVHAFEAYRPAKVAYERIRRVLNLNATPAAVRRGGLIHPSADTLELYDVHVPGQLLHVNVKATRGSIVWVQGASGSGKSALLRAIAQLAPRLRGEILYDATDLASLTERQRTRLIGYASTDLPLLPGSLGMNLQARSKVSDEMLARLIDECGLARLLQRLPDGINSRLTGRADLSVGERQAIAAIRAMAGSPPLLLLDCIDSNLDAHALKAISARLAAYPGIVVMAGCTEQFRRVATVVWKMADGQLVETCAGDSSSEETPVFASLGRAK